MKKRQVSCKTSLYVVVLIVSVGILTGCSWFEDDDSDDPTMPAGIQDCGEAFCYQASPQAGILITSDFTRAHIAGQPYGEWIVEVEWRTPEHDVALEQTVPMVIDEATGIGMAHVPAKALKQVFAEVNTRYAATQDLSLWLQPPGLQIGFFPADDKTWAYYQFY